MGPDHLGAYRFPLLIWRRRCPAAVFLVHGPAFAGLPGWQWMFILGVRACRPFILGMCDLLPFCPTVPARVPSGLPAEQKHWLESALAADPTGRANHTLFDTSLFHSF
jgi:hypothetical protein